eukprot:2537010-Rhodomonas_salina.2
MRAQEGECSFCVGRRVCGRSIKAWGQRLSLRGRTALYCAASIMLRPVFYSGWSHGTVTATVLGRAACSASTRTPMCPGLVVVRGWRRRMGASTSISLPLSLRSSR